MEGICFGLVSSFIGVSSTRADHHHAVQVSATGRTTTGSPSTVEGRRFSYLLPIRLMRLWPRRDEKVSDPEEEREEVVEERNGGRMGGNWVMKILRIGAIWEVGIEKGKNEVDEKIRRSADDGDRCVECCCVEEEEEDSDGGNEMEIDKDSFSKLLRRVSLSEASLYERLSYLGNLAYTIAKIKPRIDLKNRGLCFVTSSLEKKLKYSKEDSESGHAEEGMKMTEKVESSNDQNKEGISPSAVYRIAASAASYIQTQTQNLLPFGSHKQIVDSNPQNDAFRGETNCHIESPEEASFVVTTNSVTSVVAANDEAKEAVANDLNTSRSSPCEWFICDDDNSGTRYFVIQGSETLASWKANLLFEPIQFEDLDVLVHRGIYEAAKGIYQQMLPEISTHLESRGNSAKLCFTGHSLGGSLSLLVNLMLLIRKEAPASSLLPVITFGSPTIMCGGNYLLQKLGLPLTHVQAITMHRDIVPRAFSCNYPDHVVQILKTVNKNFRAHPCLNHQKLLYEPMGEILILQPDEKFSPPHHLLPSGSGLYAMVHSSVDSNNTRKLLRKAKSVFFSSPHPLDILSDRSAYGSEGTVTRDHDMQSYLKCIQDVINVESMHIRKAEKEHQHKAIKLKSGNTGLRQINFSSVYQVGKESMQKFQKVAVVSKHVQMFVVLLLPVQVLLVKALTVIRFG